MGRGQESEEEEEGVMVTYSRMVNKHSLNNVFPDLLAGFLRMKFYCRRREGW